MSDLFGNQIVGFSHEEAHFVMFCATGLVFGLGEKRYSGFPKRSDINRSVQSSKVARSLKFRI